MAKTEKKMSWFKFYPQDWRGDTKLRSCTIGARGLWIEMVCIMHEAEPYGHLLLGGVPVSNRQLAALAGISTKDCLTFLAELGSASVFSKENGVIYSRRMVRDREKSEKGRKDANKRWANGDDNGEPTPYPNRYPIGSPSRVPITPEARDQSNGTETRAGASLISPEAFEITTSLEQACGFALPEEIPPGWYGCAMWVQKCLNEGWIGGVMVEAAKSTALRKRNGFVESFKYLEKPLAQAMAEHKAPLPQVEVRQPEKLTVTSNGRQPQGGNVIQASDRLADTIRSFDAGPDETDGLRSGAGAVNVRLLSQG